MRVVVFVLLLLLACTTHSWATYTMLDLGTLGGTSATVSSINNRGEAVGFVNLADGNHAFYWSQSTGVIDLGRGEAKCINDQGVVVGIVLAGDAFSWTFDSGRVNYDNMQYTSINSAGQITGWINSQPVFIDEDGTITAIDTPLLSNYNLPTTINNDGLVGGYYYLDRQYHAYIWSEQEGLIVLNPLQAGTYGTWVNDVNNNGTAVGYAETTEYYSRAVWWDSAGDAHALDPLSGGYDSCAYAINDNGIVVGRSHIYTYRACYWDTLGTVYDLGTLSQYYQSTAYSINNQGWIGGNSGDHAIIWQPVPEPSNLLTLLGGLGTVAGFVIRRRAA